MNLEKTIDSARGRWRDILLHFGLDAKFLEDRHGPCPLCGEGTDRFRWDNRNGTGSYICSQCGAGSGLRLLMAFKQWDFKHAAHEVDKILDNVRVDKVKAERTEEQKRAAIRALLKHAPHIRPGTPPWLYLEGRCGDPSAICEDLRYHPALRYNAENKATFPAMLAIMRYADGQGASILRTYLTMDGQKAAVDSVRKIMPGLPVEGSAVRLGDLQERIGIAEGIETAVAAGKLFGLPVWSAISASGLRAWQPPEGVNEVLVCGDNDKNLVGQAAAFDLGTKLRAKGLIVEVKIPDIEGQDWCDVWVAQHQEVM